MDFQIFSVKSIKFNFFDEIGIDSEISNVLVAENFNTFKDQLQQTNLISDQQNRKS